MHTHPHSLTRMHTHAHTPTLTHTHAHTCTHTHTHSHACTHMHTHSHSLTPNLGSSQGGAGDHEARASVGYRCCRLKKKIGAA